MKIGEFAQICGTKISVLRHYDKEGLLVPVYTDRLTGYRYYAKEQIALFYRISALKKAGFSLSEIRTILASVTDNESILRLFQKREEELKNALSRLEEAKEIITGGTMMLSVIFEKTAGGITAKSEKIKESDIAAAYETMDSIISAQNFQRISAFSVKKTEDGAVITCEAAELSGTSQPLHEDINLPFEEDDVVGKWEIVGKYAVKEDFLAGQSGGDAAIGDQDRCLYFLPQGQYYWCYGWTKGRLLIDTGAEESVNKYEVESHDGTDYMFIHYKDYQYRRGGKPVILVLKRLDSKAYTADEIARKDNIDLPFEDDPAIIGAWKAYAFCQTKEAFDPAAPKQDSWYFKEIEFREGGVCISLYGDEVIGEDMQTWTKGYVLRKWNSTACAYEIKSISGKDYLFMEWKSGDYRWGGFDTDYYVFERK